MARFRRDASSGFAILRRLRKSAQARGPDLWSGKDVRDDLRAGAHYHIKDFTCVGYPGMDTAVFDGQGGSKFFVWNRSRSEMTGFFYPSFGSNTISPKRHAGWPSACFTDTPRVFKT